MWQAAKSKGLVEVPANNDTEQEEQKQRARSKSNKRAQVEVNEEHKMSESSPTRPEDSIKLQERQKAVEDLEQERKEFYTNLKSSVSG